MTDSVKKTDLSHVQVVIKWVPADVATLRPEWTEDQCAEWLDQNRKYLVDRSIEFGWDVMDSLVGRDPP